jgi:hypothetical protein
MIDTYVSFKKRAECWMPDIKKAATDLMDFEAYLEKLLKNKRTISTGKPANKILLEYRNILESLFDIKSILCKTHKSEIVLDRNIEGKLKSLKSNIRIFILNFYKGTKKHLKCLLNMLPEVENKKQDKKYAHNMIDIVRVGRLHSQIVEYIYSYISILFILRNLCMNIKDGISNNKRSTWKL